MPQTVHAPTARIGEAVERDVSGTEIVQADLVRQMSERIRLSLEHGAADGLATNARGAHANPALPSSFTGDGQTVDDFSRLADVPRLPPRRPPATTLHALQEWEGYVVEIGETTFTAHLTDITAGDTHESEEATIPRVELSDDDNNKMRVGSIFRWVIGYERSAAGTKKRVSQIVFRDLPVFTEADLRRGEAWAKETMRSLGLR